MNFKATTAQKQLEQQQQQELTEEQQNEAARQQQAEQQRVAMLRSRFGFVGSAGQTAQAPSQSSTTAAGTFNNLTGNIQ